MDIANLADLIPANANSRLLKVEGVEAYVSGNEQLVFDECSDDLQHMVVAPKPDEERRRCRKYLIDLIPPEWFHRKGKFTIIAVFEPSEVDEGTDSQDPSPADAG